MARKFIYDGNPLDDPDPSMSVEDVRQFFANVFPELFNASHTEKKDGEDTVITFAKRLGVKGAEEIHECQVCGHVGLDVHWQENRHKSGYFCDDGEACFERFKEQRNAEPADNNG